MNHRDDQDRTPLHYAALGGDLQIGEMLLAAGAEVNATDSQV